MSDYFAEPLPELISVEEAADLADLTPGAIRRALRVGALEGQRIGSGRGMRWVTTPEAVTVYVAWVRERAWLLDPDRRPGPRGRRRRRARS